MELDDGLLRAVPDGCVLYTLPNGIRIVRRKKHEPIDLANLSKKDLERLTNNKNGAKFLQGTTLARIVEMATEVLQKNQAQVGKNTEYNTVYEKPIGISRGRRVRGLRVVRSQEGRIAHGFPEEEDRL